MSSSQSNKRAYVAVVDDDQNILDALDSILTVDGWQVRTYDSGESFLADLDGSPPDCLILDPHLTGINGADVIQTCALRQIDFPVIGLTARPDSPVAKKMLDLGATAMFVKPVSFDRLSTQIRAVTNDREDDQ